MAISIQTAGATYSQNFDTLANTAGSTTNATLPDGWAILEAGGGARDNELYGVDTGASNSADVYSYGAAGATDRALGGLRSGTLIPTFGASFTNDTGQTITSLVIGYTGEHWRLGTVGRADRIDFEYSLDATGLGAGTWTAVDALDFATPTTATVGARDGNAVANRTALGTTITVSIPAGATFWIRWTDLDATGADDGLAIDDFTLTAIAGVVTPSLSITDIAVAEGSAGTALATFTVTLSAPAGPGGVTFDIATANGTATAGSDYVAKALTGQTIPAGASTYSFTVEVNGDLLVEPNETFSVNITNVTGATVVDGQGAGTITNDDQAPGALSVADVSVAEGDTGTTTGSFTVTRSGGAGGAVSASYAITLPGGIGGADAADVTSALAGSVAFADGETSRTITFTIAGDRIVEGDESFTVTLSAPTGGATIGTATATATITNDDVAGTVSIANVTVSEGDSGTTNATITLTRTGGSGDFTVDYATGGGTATAGADYTATSGTASFTDGATQVTFTVPIVGDTAVEGNETFDITLSGPTSGALVSTGTGTVTIADDEGAGTVSIAAASVTEGNGGTVNLVFTVTRSGGTSAFDVSVATAGITATPGVDYVEASRTVSFAADQTTATFTVIVNGDTDVEADETLSATLSAPSGNAVIGTGSATGTILTDDFVPAGTVTIADITVVEGDAGTSTAIVTLTRTGGTGAFSVDYTTLDGGGAGNAVARAGSDYAAATGTIAFADGATSATIAVTITGDTVYELAEDFRVALSNATNGAAIGDGSAVVTIANDDATPTSLRLFTENFTGFTAAGFVPTPGAGQLDSDVWRVGGLSDNTNPAYGFTGTSVDFARGIVTGNPSTAGVYSLAANGAIIVQPTGAEFDTNGFIEARIQNLSGATATDFNVGFDWVYRNNEARSANLQLSWSTDGTTFTAVPAAGFSTPGAADPTPVFAYQAEAATLTGLSVTNGGYLYLRWTHLSSSGSQNRDEVGIDNVTVDIVGTPVPTIAVSDVSVNEGAGIMTFTVTRANVVAGAFSVDYATANGTAIAGDDYTATSGTLTFAANQISAIVTVAINPDTAPEFDDTVLLNLSNAVGGVIADAQGVGTILNDDGAPIAISVADISVAEGDAGTSVATFTVTRTGGTGAFSVSFATADGTATACSDYVAASGTLSFAAGETSKTVQVTINGDLATEQSEAFTLNLSGPTNGALFSDASAVATIINDDGTLIHDIQGTSYYSPLLATSGITQFNVASPFTVTVRAVVTTLDGDGARQGFYVTEELSDWDTNNGTSEGIFVMTRNDASVGMLLATAVPGLAVGDVVTIVANVMEYQGFATAMPMTALVNPVVTIGDRGQPVPILTLDASRPIPNAIFTAVASVHNDSVDDVGDSFDATNYALSYYETIEGMLVELPSVVVADGFVEVSGGQPFFKGYSTVHANPDQINSRGGYTVAGDPINAAPDTPSPNDTVLYGGASNIDGDINPDIFEIDFTDFAIDAPSGLVNTASMGDRLGTLQGIVGFDFSTLKFYVTGIDPAGVTNGQTTRETTTLGSDPRSLTVATFNVENLDPTDGAARFTAIAQAIATNLNAPDIITIEEMQDNNGADTSGGADASTTWTLLVNALNAATGKTYQWVDQEPTPGAEGGEPGGNIRVGFLYDTARVQLGDLTPDATLAERRQFTDRIGDGVRDAGDRIAYSDDMLGNQIVGTDWTTTRKSLLGEFSFAGNSVFLVANHWPAKSGSGELWQYNQNPAGGQPLNSDFAQRNQVANDVYAMMALIQGGSPAAGIVSGGDYNDFYFYTPLTTLTGYTNPDGSARVGGPRFDNLTVTKLTEAERYTYNFDGRSQAIDHVVVNNLLNGIASYDVVHINTGFNVRGAGIDASPALSDHDPAVASFDYRSLGERLNGTGAGETILGLGGDDILDGRGGADTLVGGIGNDVYIVDSLDDIVTELAGEGDADEVRTALANYVLPANVERLVYTGAGVGLGGAVRGNAGNNGFAGGIGSDAFDLSDGGTDAAAGGDGNDVFLLGATFDATDRIDGGVGNNDQLGLQGNYTGGAALTVTGAMMTGVEVLVAQVGFDYAITTTDDLVAAGTTLKVYVAGLAAGDDFTFDGSAESDGAFQMFGGLGIDRIVTGAGNDAIYFGPGRFDQATDTVDGGGGTDVFGLDGIYNVTLTGAMVVNVETVTLLGGTASAPSRYMLTLADSFTPDAGTRSVVGTSVTTALIVDASAEVAGAIRILGGGSDDILTTGDGADFLWGGLGADTLTGNGGADVFSLQAVAESSGAGHDTIVGFTAADRIQLSTAVLGIDATVTAGELSSTTIDAGLAAALGAAQLGAGNAVLFRPDSGTLAGTTFLVIDANGTAGYQAGQDWVIQLTTPPASVAVENFIV